MIRIDSLWLAVDPMDMRAGAERQLASVVQVFGSAQAHHGYLFANMRTTRISSYWCMMASTCGAQQALMATQIPPPMATSTPPTLAVLQ